MGGRNARRAACDNPALDASVAGCRTVRSTTPKYEGQTVQYPWHRLYSRPVSIVRLCTKQGIALCRCRPLGPGENQGLEFPAWMLDRARCSTMRLERQPRVSWQALVELKQLIAASQRSSVAESPSPAQVEMNTQPGDADVEIQTQQSSQPARAVRARSKSTTVVRSTTGGPATEHSTIERATVQSLCPGVPAPTSIRRKA